MEECEQFTKRYRDICTGQGHDGRPDPPRKAVDIFRERNGLPPLPTIPHDSPTVRKLRTVQPSEPKPKQVPLTLYERAVSAAKAAAHVAVNGFHPLSEEQIAGRLAICETCDQFKNNACKLCGCSCGAGRKLLNKLAHADQECPHDPPKWGKVEP